jgi:hypothetical protein
MSPNTEPTDPGSTTDTADGDVDGEGDTDGDRNGDRDPDADDIQSSEPIVTDIRRDVETAVPPDAPVHRCAYCDRPFAAESFLVLHRGLAHADVLSAAEREVFESAYADEEADLGRFRIVALGLLVLLYFGFLFTFAVVT